MDDDAPRASAAPGRFVIYLSIKIETMMMKIWVSTRKLR